jgi:hypothetical protein
LDTAVSEFQKNDAMSSPESPDKTRALMLGKLKTPSRLASEMGLPVADVNFLCWCAINSPIKPVLMKGIQIVNVKTIVNFYDYIHLFRSKDIHWEYQGEKVEVMVTQYSGCYVGKEVIPSVVMLQVRGKSFICHESVGIAKFDTASECGIGCRNGKLV